MNHAVETWKIQTSKLDQKVEAFTPIQVSGPSTPSREHGNPELKSTMAKDHQFGDSIYQIYHNIIIHTYSYTLVRIRGNFEKSHTNSGFHGKTIYNLATLQ